MKQPIQYLPLVAAALCVAGAALAGPDGSLRGQRRLDSAPRAPEGQDDILGGTAEWLAIRTAPARTVDPRAFGAALQAARALPLAGASWIEMTSAPYDSDDPHYRDPNDSNSGGGSGLVSGRIAALAVDQAGGVVYAAAAGGGVWRSYNRGSLWTPVGDQLPSTSTGAIAVNPADRSVWVGTGEHNTSQDEYRGAGVFSSTDQGTIWTKVGGLELDGTTIGRLEWDGLGNVYAASSRGLWKHSALPGTASSSWTKVLDAGSLAQPYGMSIVNDVRVQPGTGGRVVVASMAWRNGAAYNGFYVSRNYGAPGSFVFANLQGAINPKVVGRASLAFSADGHKLYTVVEDIFLLNKPNVQSGNTVLAGVFVSNSGDIEGPWNQIADYRKLQNSGSALKLSKGYAPGIQAWYNQFIAVDPADSQHVYLGLEEVFETRNGGSTWYTIGPYWNFSFDCYSVNPDSCPKTTHSDQHGVALDATDVYIGSDGGVWRRSLRQDPSLVDGWVDLNATLRTLQYYSVAAGSLAGGGYALWGGLQDNGESLLLPGAPTMVSPAGGDGGYTIVDPRNGLRVVEEYVGLDMSLSTNAGNTDFTPFSWREVSPSCSAFLYTPNPCDPGARFIAPFEADIKNPDHWVAGGRYVWDNQSKGWDTTCGSAGCDWTILYDTGAGHSISAIGVSGSAIYIGWGTGNPSETSTNDAGFNRGLASNLGGAWHDITGALPNRFPTGFAIDPFDARHVFVCFGGFSRLWIPSAGVGHVFESINGGATWTDISGNLPDIPAAHVLLANGKLALATDVGVFLGTRSGTAWNWSRLGSALPNAPCNRVALSPAGEVLVGTHGRGIWGITIP
jgi:hypothetical protein